MGDDADDDFESHEPEDQHEGDGEKASIRVGAYFVRGASVVVVLMPVAVVVMRMGHAYTLLRRQVARLAGLVTARRAPVSAWPRLLSAPAAAFWECGR